LRPCINFKREGGRREEGLLSLFFFPPLDLFFSLLFGEEEGGFFSLLSSPYDAWETKPKHSAFAVLCALENA
jgi:hypothetical protein